MQCNPSSISEPSTTEYNRVQREERKRERERELLIAKGKREEGKEGGLAADT